LFYPLAHCLWHGPGEAIILLISRAMKIERSVLSQKWNVVLRKLEFAGVVLLIAMVTEELRVICYIRARATVSRFQEASTLNVKRRPARPEMQARYLPPAFQQAKR